MKERIKLDDREFHAALDALRDNTNVPWKTHLTRIIAAINDLRDGDPVGTVRRGVGWCESGESASAIKTEKGWRLVHEGGDCRSWIAMAHQWDEFISSWPVVYSPEA